MQLIIHTIINTPISSNCYVLYNLVGDECIVIDPGSEDNEQLIRFLNENKLNPRYIILTHEHFDHIWGVSGLKKKYPNIALICSKLCGELMQDAKKNLSVFHNQKGFVINKNDINIEDVNYEMELLGYNIYFFSTQGHSDSSISLVVNDNLFVGDLIMEGNHVVTKLPSGSKQKLKESLKMLLSRLDNNKTMVYSGHNSPFLLSQIKIEKINI